MNLNSNEDMSQSNQIKAMASIEHFKDAYRLIKTAAFNIKKLIEGCYFFEEASQHDSLILLKGWAEKIENEIEQISYKLRRIG